MKKAFAMFGVTIGFAALAMMVIFFAETTTNLNFSLPKGNLSADIAANNPAAPASPAPADQLADVSANAIAASDSPQVVVPAASAALIDASVQAAQAETPATTTPAPVPTSPVTPIIAPASALPPLPTLIPTGPGTSTVATATITVTPTAPTPPLLSALPQTTTPLPPVAGDLVLPYNESSFTGDGNWQTVWGVANTTFSGSLDLSAGLAGTGGAIYLKNSAGWANYTMSATVNWAGGEAISLMANYQDASNYVACEYEKSGPGIISMQLVQYMNGIKIFLTSGVPVSWSGDGSNLAASISVNGVHGACSLNGQTVSNDSVGPGKFAMSTPGSGGVGFNMNDPNPDTSELIVKQVSVAVD